MDNKQQQQISPNTTAPFGRTDSGGLAIDSPLIFQQISDGFQSIIEGIGNLGRDPPPPPKLQLNTQTTPEDENDPYINSSKDEFLTTAESMRRVLQEQLRAVEEKIAQDSSVDDPISQIKVWFEMRQLKANLEKDLREVEHNLVNRHRERAGLPPNVLEESVWDIFSSFLPSPSLNNSTNSTVSSTTSDSDLSSVHSDDDVTGGYAHNDTASFYTNYPILPTKPTFPARSSVTARAHIDCSNYFAAVARALDGAKREIFITGWFLSPELYLVRDPLPNMDFRLDRLLFKKAREGVKIYIILWDETKIAMFKGSKRAKEMLEGLHTGVKVLRHPPYTPIYWSHHQKLVVVDQELAFVGGVDLCFGRYDNAHHELVDLNGNKWPGKDYYNPTVTPMGDITRPFEDGLDRVRVPRMPWHDIMISVDGEAARDVAMNFILRWNHHRLGEWDEESYPIVSPLTGLPLLPPSAKELDPITATCTCQVLRSISEWSGASVVESTIHSAYLEAIEDSEHYIYIENQNFVSATAGIGVKNQVSVEILRRIKRAIRKKETFRVYIMLPIQPDGVFELEASIRGIMYWQYLTISRGGMSIIEQLRRDHPEVDPSEYISFYSLRTHDKLDGVAFSQQVYVHSKMMIVDDRVVIIGSNNINDRSLLGDRDSELAIIVRDDAQKVVSKMNGKEFLANRFAHSLRIRLFQEHLGLPIDDDPTDQTMTTTPITQKRILQVDVTDPTCSSFYRDTWMAVAKANTKIYEHVFSNIPRDSIGTLADYVARSHSSVPVDDNLLTEVQGYLVFHPIDFLSKENLSPSFFEAALLRDELFQ